MWGFSTEISLEDHFYRSGWGARLDSVMDLVEDSLFDDPGRTLDHCKDLDRLFALEPGLVSEAHQLRAEGLFLTARSLTGSLREAARAISLLLPRAKQANLPQDLVGWLHAKYANMLVKLDHPDQADDLIEKALTDLTQKNEPVRAVKAQLFLARARLLRGRDDWESCRELCLEAYRIASHRRATQGGYYRRGDITRAAAVLNLVAVTNYLEETPERALAFLARMNVAAYHKFRRAWGYAPYNEVVTARLIGALHARCGSIAAAVDETAWATRGFVKLSRPLEALDAALDLAELDSDHYEVARTMSTVAQLPVAEELLELLDTAAPHRTHREQLRAAVERARKEQRKLFAA